MLGGCLFLQCAAAVVCFTCPVLQNAGKLESSASTLSNTRKASRVSPITMNAFDGLQKNGKKLNKNVAKNIAEQIGLNVVPKGKDAKKPKVATPEPTIKWSEEVKEFFWGERGDDDGVEQVENEEGFPLLVLKDVLDEASLEKALKMANDALDDAEVAFSLSGS